MSPFGWGARLRPLRPATAEAAMRLALREPVMNALAGARLRDLLGRSALSREFWIHGVDRTPDGVLWHGVNIAPLSAGPTALAAFADHLAVRERRASSIVGPRPAVEALWQRMGGAWERGVREYRWSQPVLLASAPPEPPSALSRPSIGAPSPADEAPHGAGRVGLRRAEPGEEDAVYPAAVAMFTEEVGIDPTLGDGGRAYRARVTELVRAGRTYVVTDRDRRVVFKADVGAVFGSVAQIHGVWTAPELRGRGIGRRAMAELVPLVQAAHAPQVSLYVNDFNEPARRAYAAAGFRPVGELSTILF